MYLRNNVWLEDEEAERTDDTGLHGSWPLGGVFHVSAQGERLWIEILVLLDMWD